MNPTRRLREEHQLILQVLDCFETALAEAVESGEVHRSVFEPFVKFFQGFADQCHHCREEDHLFPCMEQAGIPREGGPIGVMLHEHQQARMHVRTISEHLEAADTGDSDAVQIIFDHGRSYLNLLRAHIDKEDHCLFGMADQLIQGPQLTSLNQSYEETESEPEYCAKLKRCRANADTLIEQYGSVTN